MTLRTGWSHRLRLAVYRIQDRLAPSETTLMVGVAVAVGVLGAFGAILFRLAGDFFQGFAIGHGDQTAALLAPLPWWRKLLLPVVGALLVGPLVHFGAREAKGHGVPEVLNALAFKNGIIRPIVAAVKILASAITIGFGGSVGREGPIVQIGASLASSLGQGLRFSPQRLRTMIGCGAAAGIAATFNAPIAGAFFALEILLRDFAVVTFSPIIVASVVATAVSRHYLGDTPAFPVPGFQLNSPLEFPLYLVMGLVVGLVALVYVRALYFTEGRFDRLRFPAPLKPLLGAVPLGVLFFWYPQVYGVGYESMVEALDGRLDLTLMAVLVVVKLLAVCLTLGSGFSGGIFAPALFLGGMTGGACGGLFNLLWPGLDVPVGAFAMVGMAAMVGAATGGPLTAILILFEMTGEYRVILPLMLAGVTANLGYRALMGDSIFTLRFTLQGRRLEFGRESAILRRYQVGDIMAANPRTLAPDAPFERIFRLFLDSNEEHYYVTDPDGRLAGRITIHDVKGILHEESLGRVLIAADLVADVPAVVYRTDTLEDCLLRLGSDDTSDLPVLASPEHLVLVGVVTRKAIFEVYNREVLNQEDLGIKLVHGETRLRDCVDLPEAYKVQVLIPPPSWVGRTLHELELRPRYRVSVLAVKHRSLLGSGRNELPDPDRPLVAGDRLILVGEVDDLERLREDSRRDLVGRAPAGS